MSQDLFSENDSSNSSLYPTASDAPLAYRMRPRSLEEFAGQEHILGEGMLLRRTILADRLTSLIFYGPPGSGKTTLAYLIARWTKAMFQVVNAVTSNVQELRKILDEAGRRKKYESRRTILFIDEIHRFNKAQQDILMPDVESGTVTLLGSTTHNPFFSVNGSLLSRSLIFELRPLEESRILHVLRNALADKERGYGGIAIDVTEEALMHLAKSACGDARRALNALEIGVLSTLPSTDGTIRFDKKVAEESCQKKLVFYDGDEDYHYDTASAFIKSMRGSDPDATIYWLAKMLYAGEDPRFIVRRMLILASEDIGNADPQALVLAQSAMQACEFVGMPEARLILAQTALYLAAAPKSNASCAALEAATRDIEQEKVEEVPDALRDTSYQGAKKLGHGQGYQYPHRLPGHFIKQTYRNGEKEYYRPSAMGFEKNIRDRLNELRRGKPSP